MAIIDVVTRAQREPAWRPADSPLLSDLVCSVIQPVSWDRMQVERAIGVDVPDELGALWDCCGGLRLYEDIAYGQWGLIVLSPQEAIAVNREYQSRERVRARHGDVVFAKFRGDRELALVRSDREATDFGAVLIVDEMDPREDWTTAAHSIEEFLSGFMNMPGRKYWEVNR